MVLTFRASAREKRNLGSHGPWLRRSLYLPRELCSTGRADSGRSYQSKRQTTSIVRSGPRVHSAALLLLECRPCQSPTFRNLAEVPRRWSIPAEYFLPNTSEYSGSSSGVHHRFLVPMETDIRRGL